MNLGLGGWFPLLPPGQGGLSGDLAALLGGQLFGAGLSATTSEELGVLL